MRLDSFLAEHGLVPSREKAKELIRGGQVYVDGRPVVKPSAKIPEDQGNRVEIRGGMQPFVSRGGLKLRKAVESFRLDLEGLTCMDVGASTGGFTDCMLQNGASRVYSLDVGHGQLDWKLRGDDRVVCMEKFNARHLTPEDVPEKIAFSSIDVSFISLKLILGPVMSVLEDGGGIVSLIKPQFEAGREKVGKKGVVRDKVVHEEVIRDVTGYASQAGLRCLGLTFSPVTGPEGNIEYLAYFRREVPGTGDTGERDVPDIASVVAGAHEALS